jgi:hypothetical protein
MRTCIWIAALLVMEMATFGSRVAVAEEPAFPASRAVGAKPEKTERRGGKDPAVCRLAINGVCRDTETGGGTGADESGTVRKPIRHRE